MNSQQVLLLVVIAVLMALVMPVNQSELNQIEISYTTAFMPDLDSICGVAVFDEPDAVASHEVYFVPCSTGAGPLEIELESTPICIEDLECKYSIQSSGVINWSYLGNPFYVVVLSSDRDASYYIGIQIEEPRV